MDGDIEEMKKTNKHNLFVYSNVQGYFSDVIYILDANVQIADLFTYYFTLYICIIYVIILYRVYSQQITGDEKGTQYLRQKHFIKAIIITVVSIVQTLELRFKCKYVIKNRYDNEKYLNLFQYCYFSVTGKCLSEFIYSNKYIINTITIIVVSIATNR